MAVASGWSMAVARLEHVGWFISSARLDQGCGIAEAAGAWLAVASLGHCRSIVG